MLGDFLSDVEKLAELKKRLEDEREKLLERINEITLLLQLIDAYLREQSFVSAEKLLKEETTRRVEKKVPKRELEVLRFRGKVILKGEVTPDSITIYVDPEAKIPMNSGPIRYLIKLLDKHMEDDLKLIKDGLLSSDKKLTYIIDEENGNLSKIKVINYNTNKRLRDILSNVRWAVRTLLRESSKA